MIPLSMYVSMEMVRFVNARDISADETLLVTPVAAAGAKIRRGVSSENNDRVEPLIGAQARNASVVEELGQVQYVFSDKTGTLTRNQMVLVQCSVAGVRYGHSTSNAAPAASLNESRKAHAAAADSGLASVRVATQPHLVTPVGSLQDNIDGADECKGDEDASSDGYQPVPHISNVVSEDVVTGNDQQAVWFNDRRVLEPLLSGHSGQAGQQSSVTRDFLLSMALCHAVMPTVESSTDDPSSPVLISYSSASPDETALVEGARRLGVVLLRRQDDRITIDFLGRLEVWVLAATFEFNSDRKRMSILAKGPFPPSENDPIVLASAHRGVWASIPLPIPCWHVFAKGADSVMLPPPRLNSIDPFPLASPALVQQHLTEFASAGLRTLCLGGREVPSPEAEALIKDFQVASVAMVRRAQRLDEVAALVETSLHLLGITAIEDRLQEGVPECVTQMREAGIKVWVCTV
jgi:magnesium-transporting ATPase (P-type)